MNYQKIYAQLIESRKRKTTEDTYHERHHILPRKLGGDESKDNLVKLTAREHYVSHWLLAKIHGGPMWVALNIMSKNPASQKSNWRPTSRAVDTARKNMSLAVSGNKNGFYGKRHSKETIQKLMINNPVLRGEVRGEKHHNHGKKFDYGPIISFVKKR